MPSLTSVVGVKILMNEYVQSAASLKKLTFLRRMSNNQIRVAHPLHEREELPNSHVDEAFREAGRGHSRRSVIDVLRRDLSRLSHPEGRRAGTVQGLLEVVLRD